MKNAKMVALSAISTAFATVFLVIGNWFTSFSLAAAMYASVAIMLPLSKKSYKGAILCYLASVILTGIFSGFFTRWDALLPFAAFCGLHPVVNSFLKEKKVNKVLAFAVKDVWFVGALVLTHVFTKLYIGDNEFINKYIFPIIIGGGALVFWLYDYVMGKLQTVVSALVVRLKL